MIEDVNWRRLFFYSLNCGLFFLFSAFVVLAFQVFFANSEIWSVNLGYNFWKELASPWVISRTAFYLPLNLVQLWTTDPIFNLYFSRALMLVWTGFLVYQMMRLAQEFFKDSAEHFRWSFTFALVLLFSHTTYLNQGFRIRSDFVSAALALWSVRYFLFSKRPTIAKDFLFFFLPLLATPKAVIYLLSFLVFKPWQRVWDQARTRLIFLGVSGILSVVFLTLYFDSFLFFERALFQQLGSPDYFSHKAFHHIFKSITMNPLFYALFAYGFYSVANRFKPQTFQKSGWNKYEVFCMLLTFLLLVLPEKVPFFIASLIPFWVLWMQSFILKWFEDFPPKKIFVGFAVLFFLIFQSLQWTVENFMKNSNRDQVHDFRILADYMVANQIENYFDGVGFFPARDRYRVFAGPNSLESMATAEQILIDTAPDFMVLTPPLHELETKHFRILRDQYILIQGHIHVRAVNFTNMTRNEIEKWFQSMEQTGGLDRNAIVEIVTKKNALVVGVERINLTLAQLLRKYNDIMFSQRAGSPLKTEIYKVSLFPELKVGMHGSLEEIFRFDVEF